MKEIVPTSKKLKTLKKIAVTVAFFLGVSNSYAQFYSTGADPASIKWKQLKTEDRRVIFPDYYGDKARIINDYLDFLTPHITYNLSPKVEKFDVILHTNNIQSNGLVAWAPKRMELFLPPPSEQFSVPWMKQLLTHEYRHIIQMSNLNVGLTRILRYVTGEQVVGLIASIPPTWFFEGDAVLAETQFTFNGRGNQPSFSMGLRAFLNENSNITTRLYDKWKMGSYKDYTPSIYEFGYFMTAATYRNYGDEYWNTLLRYIGRNPYLIIADYFASKKYYQTTTTDIFKRTMKELRLFWHDESQMPNSSNILKLSYKSYTTYDSPQYLSDTTIFTRKYSFDTPKHFVAVNNTKNMEEKLRYAPFSDTRALIKDSVVYWNELVPSLFYEHDINSVVKRSKLYTKGGKLKMSRPKTIYKSDNNEFVTPLTDNRFALVEYDQKNNPRINIYSSDFKTLETFDFEGNDNTITGMAYDEKTSKLCYIIIDNRGATIESIDLNTKEKNIVCGPTYIALSSLSAEDGRLFFGSTESGKDEAHALDLNTNEQYQLSSSQYGSFAGVGGKKDKVMMTTYTIDGYMLSEQKFALDTLRAVSSSKKMPKNRVTVPTVDWDVPKIDTIDVTIANVDQNYGKTKKYNKTSHLFNVHSWFPAFLDVNKVIDEQQFDLGVGATVITQNSLGTFSGFMGYGWVPKNKKSLFMTELNYSALPVHVGLGINYGGASQEVYSYSEKNDLSDIGGKNRLNVDLDLSLPMNFSGGSNIRVLKPYVNTVFSNSLIVDENNHVNNNIGTKTKYGVSYVSYRAMARKDVAPRWGYSLLVGGMSNPLKNNFGNVVNCYAKAFLPGAFAHHSLGVTAGYSKQFASTYNYIQEFMLPRGNTLYVPTNNTFSTFVNYKMPVINSDFIIPSTINIKRIALDVFGEYSRCNYMPMELKPDKNVYSYGAELLFTTHIIGISTFSMDLGLSAYKASQLKGAQFGFSFNLNY